MMRFVGGVLAAIIILVAVLCILPTMCGIASVPMKYFNRSVQQIQVESVEYNWAKAYSLKEDMENAAQKYCVAKKAYILALESGDGNATNQRQTQLIATENIYSNVRSKYDEELSNAFKLKYVAPNDVYPMGVNLSDMVLILRLDCGE